MKLEIKSLKSQNTWKLTIPPQNRKVIKGRWVYKIKTNADNTVYKYKARWVVKGFS